MRKSNLTVWLLTLFVASMGGVEPSNADVCFIVGGCEKPSINTKDCKSLGYTRTSCDSVKEIVYDTCVSKGEKFVKCTCNPNYYMLTANPSNASAYDIEECTKVDGKKLYRATCKSDYKYTLSTIAREDGKTNSKQCDTGKTPVADGGICTMLYGNNVNKILYKDCDCDSSYIYKKETPGFSYSGECTYKYGDNADETLYTTVTCDTNNHYQSDACKEPLVEDKAYKHSQKDLTCRTCKCPDRYKYASDKLTGVFSKSGNSCGGLYESYSCATGWTKIKCTEKEKSCIVETNETYDAVKCYKTCETQGGLTKTECWAKINNTADSSSHYCRKNTEFDDCYHFEEGGKCPVVAKCPTGFYDSETSCKTGLQTGYECSKAIASETGGLTGCYKRIQSANTFKLIIQDYCTGKCEGEENFDIVNSDTPKGYRRCIDNLCPNGACSQYYIPLKFSTTINGKTYTSDYGEDKEWVIPIPTQTPTTSDDGYSIIYYSKGFVYPDSACYGQVQTPVELSVKYISSDGKEDSQNDMLKINSFYVKAGETIKFVKRCSCLKFDSNIYPEYYNY